MRHATTHENAFPSTRGYPAPSEHLSHVSFSVFHNPHRTTTADLCTTDVPICMTGKAESALDRIHN